MARTSKGRVLFAGGEPTSALTREDMDRLKQTIGEGYPRIIAALDAVRAELPQSTVPPSAEVCVASPKKRRPPTGRPIGRPKKEAPADKWADPRDVPLWKPSVYLRWCLDNDALREPGQHAAMTALWFEDGDVEACARVTGRSPTYLADLLRRAKSEVRAAARQMDWQEGWAATRLEPGPHSVGRVQLADSRVWFPPPCDWMAFAFEMNRRVGL